MFDLTTLISLAIAVVGTPVWRELATRTRARVTDDKTQEVPLRPAAQHKRLVGKKLCTDGTMLLAEVTGSRLSQPRPKTALSASIRQEATMRRIELAKAP